MGTSTVGDSLPSACQIQRVLSFGILKGKDKKHTLLVLTLVFSFS